MILDIIKEDELKARKVRNTEESLILNTLRSEAQMVGKNSNRETLDSETIVVVKKFVKNLNEFLAIPGVDESSKLSCLKEIEIISKYLPKQLSKEDISEKIADLKVKNPSVNLPMVMAYFKTEWNGQYDGREVSTLCKELL